MAHVGVEPDNCDTEKCGISFNDRLKRSLKKNNSEFMTISAK